MSNARQLRQSDNISPTDKTIQNLPTSAQTQEAITVPAENTIYLGTYNGDDALFYTDAEKRKYFDSASVPKTSASMGKILISGGDGYAPIDFSKLKSPKRIYSSSKKINDLYSFKLNNSKSVAYVALTYLSEVNGQYPNMTNKIIQIKLDNLASSEIWSNQIGSNKYEGGKGSAVLESITEDKFLSFWIYDCYACEGVPAGTVLLNTITKKEKYLKDIGNIQINISNNSFSYQKLFPFQQPCDPSPGCDNGQRTVMKPAGQIYTDYLS